MTDYIEAWQCIGCGKLEAPQPCIGVCQDRKVSLVGKGEHEQIEAEAEQLRQQLEAACALLARMVRTKPRQGQVERCWSSFQQQARDLLADQGHQGGS